LLLNNIYNCSIDSSSSQYLARRFCYESRLRRNPTIVVCMSNAVIKRDRFYYVFLGAHVIVRLQYGFFKISVPGYAAH